MTCSPLEYFAFPASLLFLVVVGEDCVKMCHDYVPSFEPEPELFLEWVLDLDLVSVGVLLGLDGYITWPNIITIFQIIQFKISINPTPNHFSTDCRYWVNFVYCVSVPDSKLFDSVIEFWHLLSDNDNEFWFWFIFGREAVQNCWFMSKNRNANR